MTEIKTYCDKCGKELTMITENYEDTEISIANYWRKVDLCSSCFEKLTDIVENFFNESEENE